MNIRLTSIFLLAAVCFYALFGHAAVPTAYDNEKFIQVSIQKIQNMTRTDCAFESDEVSAQETVELNPPVKIPFISIKSYLREFASSRAFTPQNALSIEIGHVLYRLWASESGITCAMDSEKNKVSIDTWKAEEIALSNKKQDHPGKKVVLATLILKMLGNKLKFSLEPARS